MDNRFLFVEATGFYLMGCCGFRRNVMRQTSSFMLIWISTWFVAGVVDWQRGQNFITTVTSMVYWSVSVHSNNKFFKSVTYDQFIGNQCLPDFLHWWMSNVTFYFIIVMISYNQIFWKQEIINYNCQWSSLMLYIVFFRYGKSSGLPEIVMDEEYQYLIPTGPWTMNYFFYVQGIQWSS